MQRILRSSMLYSALSSETREQHQVLLKVCPPHLAQLFAIGRSGSDDQLEWWTPLGGQAKPYSALPDEQQKQLLKVFEQRKKSLAELAGHLEQQGQVAPAQTLRRLLSEIDVSKLYSIDNQPVLVEYYPAVEAKVIPPVAAASTAALATGTAAVAVAPRVLKKRALWPWLLLLLLLLGLALLAWWQLLYKDVSFLNAVKLFTERGSRIENYACANQQTKSKPDFVTVFDTSGSMTLNINASAADEEWLLDIGGLYEHDNRDPRRLRVLSSPTREEVAKQAYGHMLANLHPDIDTRLITFAGCGSVIDHGVHNHQQRPQLLERLTQSKAEDGTPLAESLRVAASQVDGVNTDAMIILFIDGEDGCGDNVCALAGQLAAEKPRLQINVVDVSGNGLSSCAARLTNGRIYSSQDAEQINALFLEAAEEFTATACE